ncbi:9952_t:CDS:10 [Paraglomus brasilianum]|uniref:9952_t:CDS:1 n=1 Tax=Paraglomus brasilianum TaxID=144538 RepID=A0A9N8ZW04_9GLOM|nr:9952_t:CDS:10 [Paraglomus brasilianum]
MDAIDNEQELESIKGFLRRSVHECSQRGLYFAAKWAAQTLASLPKITTTTTAATSSSSLPLSSSYPSHSNADEEEQDKYLLAKTYFDVKEFDRAAYVLNGCVGVKQRFLRVYAKYLAGEKRKEEDNHDIMSPLDDPKAVNKELLELLDELETWYNNGEMDGFLLYIYGVILRQRCAQSKATEVLLKSINAYPYNWSAWVELVGTFANQSAAKHISTHLPQSFMTKFFQLYCAVELHDNAKNFNQMTEEVPKVFENNNFVKTQKAIYAYHNQNYAEAEQEFDSLIESDPYRLDDMDIFSNVLYVMEKKAKLSYLAHMSSATDKYRSETMCIVGNYYSLKFEREKAISYFKRALQVNRNCLTAWTLMGHEYVELKNTHAAVVAYKRALEVNPRDYRAWFGLGQTYECLQMPFYAMYYYQRAVVLRPSDARMWGALAALYEKQSLQVEAIKCYQRVLGCTDNDIESSTAAIIKLARLYETLNRDKAANYFEMVLQQKAREVAAIDSDEAKHAHIFLAYYKSDKGDIAAATLHAQEMMEYGDAAKEEARKLMSELNTRQNALQFT